MSTSEVPLTKDKKWSLPNQRNTVGCMIFVACCMQRAATSLTYHLHVVGCCLLVMLLILFVVHVVVCWLLFVVHFVVCWLLFVGHVVVCCMQRAATRLTYHLHPQSRNKGVTASP